MLLHTQREKEAAVVFGVTDPFGVTLINRCHAFPLLVVEEEKTHAALLANTTHGALYRSLGSMFPQPNANITFQLSPKENINDISALLVYNRMRSSKDRVLGRALAIHEAFAKYCAFCFQYSLNKQQSNAALDELWNKETTRYGLMLELSRVIARPASVTKYRPVFLAAYKAAKAVLNISSFDNFLAIRSARKLYDQLSRPLFDEVLEKRFEIVLAEIENAKNGQSSASADIFSDHAGLEPAFVEALRRSGLHGQLGIDTATLSARSVLLGKRLESLGNGQLYCHLESRHVAFAMGHWIDLDPRTLHPDGRLITYPEPQSISGRLGSDPSLTVSYDCFAGNNTWPEGRLAAHSLQNMQEVIVYLAAGSTGNIDCYTIMQARDQSAPIMFVDRNNEWKNLESHLFRVGRLRLAIVMLPPSFGTYSLSVPATEVLGSALEYLGTVVYWSPVSSPSEIIYSTPFVYFEHRAAEPPEASVRNPVGLLTQQRDYVTVGAIPFYVIEMVNSVLPASFKGSNGLDPAFRLLTSPVHSIVETVLDQRAKQIPPEIVVAARVYRHFYEYGKLPGQLPLYESQNLFRLIYDQLNGDENHDTRSAN